MESKNDTLGVSNHDFLNHMDRKPIIDEIYQSGSSIESRCDYRGTAIAGTRGKQPHAGSGVIRSITKGNPTSDVLYDVSGSGNDDDDLSTTNNYQTPVYRHTFTQEFTEQMYSFSKIHQYDDRHSFKEAWAQWTEENKDLILNETRKLENNGYHGNIMDKMFKSARYYFRKKSTEKKAPIKRRNYIGMSRNLLESIDIHIYESIKNPDYKPSNGYNDFYEKNTETIENEIESWALNGQLNQKEDMIAKIKKTYKNRYFVITNKNK